MKIKILGREIKLNRAHVLGIGILMIFSIVFISWLLLRDDSVIIIDKSSNKNSDQINKMSNELKSMSPMSSTTVVTDNTVKKNVDQNLEINVYVVGAVNKPGIYKLAKGSMIHDAVLLAGGVSTNADLENINMVYQLNDNVMIKVKSKNANENKDNNQTQLEKDGVEIIQDSYGAVISSNDEEEKKGGKVDINKAAIGQLDALPGIGASTAQKIIAHREKNGNFKTTKDIMNVPGIGESKFEAIKDLITVDS